MSLATSPNDSSPSRAERQRIGVLDIGSNSVRLVIYDVYGSSFVPIYNEKIHAGLGRDLRETGRLSEEGLAETEAALARFSLILDAQNVDHVSIGATAALREAEDAPAFIARVKEKTGLDLSPVSGEEEARLSAMGLLAAIPRACGLAADLGGASLELIHVENRAPGIGKTYPLGPFRMLGQNLTGDAFAPDVLRGQIYDIFEAEHLDANALKGEALYLIGGAWRNLAHIHQTRHDYPLRKVQSYHLSPKQALEFCDWAVGDGREDVVNFPGISSRRGETLPYGALLLSELIKRLNPARVVFSDTGLREGLIYAALAPQQRKRDALHDGCRDLARGNQQGKAKFSKVLIKFLSDASAHFPMSFTPQDERRLRKAACMLVGVGKGLDPNYRADLVFEDVLYAPLAGLTHKERAYLALIIFRSFTGRSKTPNDAAVNLLLDEAERRAAEVYGLAIRLAVVGSGRSTSLLKKLTLTVKDGVPHVRAEPGYEALLGPRLELRLLRLASVLEAGAQ
jgi:exopolyphosphatase/guanosine-5'-triphosphate,3'-diphosphate pyrophosphatase